MLSQSAISARVRVQGKDAIDRFSTQRGDFIRDACIEISMAQEYSWLYETVDLTVPATPTDWFNISPGALAGSESLFSVEAVYYGGKHFTFLEEKDYAADLVNFDAAAIGMYRIRYDADNARFQMKLLNPPPANATIQVLLKKVLNDPARFPDFMEEVITQGALYRFLMFLEGDDLPVAEMVRGEYLRVAIQAERNKPGAPRPGSQPVRTKTLRELDNAAISRYTGE